jgi:uncharacterized protein YprB with RNaseH-like and TPR domain
VAQNPSISDLSQVIRRLEAKSRAPAPVRRTGSLEDLLGGSVEETDKGQVLCVRRRFLSGHCHGRQPLDAARAISHHPLALLARSGEPPKGRRLLYLDTETTGLAGGTGTYAFLVGVGFFDGDEFEVRQYFMRDLDEEPALLAALDPLLADVDGLVTYNGAGFDLPLLETRFVLARRRWPGALPHLDLLPAARRLWSARLSDCRLATVEQHALGFAREGDLPGALIPQAYFDYLRGKAPGELPRVFEHNRHDILSLAALTGWVTEAVARAPQPHHGADELAGLGRLWETVDIERGEACYRMALDRGLLSPARERLFARLAWHEKRRARWDASRELWEAAARCARGFEARPWEEIAKIHEHRRRDFAAAHAVVTEALERARAQRAPEPVLHALAHRLGRLARRQRPLG